MIRKQVVLHADFDGTLFDPSIHVFLSPIFNQLTVRLMRRHNVLLVLNTGRPIWNWFSNLQLVTTGMKKADVVVVGCGTTILWRKGWSLVKDQEWERRMKETGWNKKEINKKIAPLLAKEKAAFFDTTNPYMTRVWVYDKNVPELKKFTDKLKKLLPRTKILWTEQILLPNTTEVFSGYLLFVPDRAGKEKAAAYVTQKLHERTRDELQNIYVGDAFVDVPLLSHDPSAMSYSYGIHPTPLAKQALNKLKIPVILGSPPQIVYRAVKSHVEVNRSARNSSYRSLLLPMFSLLDSYVYPKLSPNQISLKGLEMVSQAVKSGKPSDIFTLIKGNLMDAFDGIRARKHPDQATEDGQLIDVYADRLKEYTQLASRKQYDAAISCFLPSIARAQAEAVGEVVPEIDVAGGTTINRMMKLTWSYLSYTLGTLHRSEKVDQNLLQANLSSYYNRRKYGYMFDWNKIQEYDKIAVTRLLFLIHLLQTQIKKAKITNPNLKDALVEYELIRVSKIQKALSISLPHIDRASS